MFDEKIINTAIQQGGVTFVAVFAIWQLSRLQNRFDELTRVVVDLVKQNSTALADLKSAVISLDSSVRTGGSPLRRRADLGE